MYRYLPSLGADQNGPALSPSNDQRELILLATSKRLIFSEGVHTISVEEVYAATREMLAVERMTTLFAS